MDNLQDIKQIASLSHIDGLIIPIPSDEHTEYVKTLGLPLVTTYFERPEISSVSIDHARAVQLAFQHLYDKGHREIAYLAPSLNASQTTKRLRSYRECLKKYAITYQPDYVVCDGNSDSANFGYKNFKKLWKNFKPTAILAYNDSFAIGIMNAANELGLRVGEELSIIGIDGTPESAHTTPALTTISIGLKRMGQKAVELLEERISKHKYDVKQITMPLKLIERGSVATINQE
jgi:LacI family transcriptional regulator